MSEARIKRRTRIAECEIEEVVERLGVWCRCDEFWIAVNDFDVDILDVFESCKHAEVQTRNWSGGSMGGTTVTVWAIGATQLRKEIKARLRDHIGTAAGRRTKAEKQEVAPRTPTASERLGLTLEEAGNLSKFVQNWEMRSPSDILEALVSYEIPKPFNHVSSVGLLSMAGARAHLRDKIALPINRDGVQKAKVVTTHAEPKVGEPDA